MNVALIRTHHITSRKKISALKSAASRTKVHFVLLRSGGSPGLMYVEGEAHAVSSWIEVVKSLKYKDYHLVCRPEPLKREPRRTCRDRLCEAGFNEEASVKEFAAQLESRGVLAWWQAVMGFKPSQ